MQFTAASLMLYITMNIVFIGGIKLFEIIGSWRAF